MKLSKRTINSLMKDLEKQKNEFNQHPIPKCMFQFFIQIPKEIYADDDLELHFDNYEVQLVIRKHIYETKIVK